MKALSLRSEQRSPHERNEAVWALGQLRDPRALPVLESAYASSYAGTPCNPNLFLCQYGLDKAIEACETPNILFIHTRRAQQ